MNRRHLLRATALAVPVIALAACSTAQVQAIETQALSDLNILSTGLTSFAPLFEAVTGVTSTAVAEVEGYASDISKAVETISATTAQAAAQPVVQQIAGYATAIIAIASGYALPASVSAILAAAKVLLPVIEAEVGIPTAAAPVGGMSPDAARAVLAGA